MEAISYHRGMKAGELYWNVEPVILYADLNSAIWDAGSVPADDYDGPLRCRQLSAFLKKPISFCESGKYFLVINTEYLQGDNFNDIMMAVEVLIDDQHGWIVKRDFSRLLAASK